MKKYYTYAYLRRDKTPYYIGKGEGSRAYVKHIGRAKLPTDRDRILILKRNLTEEEAFRHEKYLIAVYKRVEEGGLLYNQTDGGEGISGYRHTEETKRLCGLSTLGRKESEEHKAWRSQLIREAYQNKTQEDKTIVAERNLKFNTQRQPVVVEGREFASMNEAARWALRTYNIGRNTALRYIKEGRSFTNKKRKNLKYKGSHVSAVVL